MTFFNQKKKLWKEGETTLGYISPQSSFSHEKRFKHFSIYWPEKSASVTVVKKQKSEAEELAIKISKQIDEEEKNEIRMNKGKNSFRKIVSKSNLPNKEPVSTFRETKTTRLSKENQQIIGRLTEVGFRKQSLLRDRHGNRTNLFENQEDQLLSKLKESKGFRSTDKGFYTSRRIKLQLPHNYYPGPGTYQIKRYLQQQHRPRSHRPKARAPQARQLF